MRALLVLVAVVSACGFEQSNAIDVPHVEGRPVKLANVRMAESLYATLATGPTKMSSGMEANAIGIAYEIEIVEPAPQYAGVVAQLACRVDGHTIVTPLATDAGDRLASAEVGTKIEARDSFAPTPFERAIPKVCESTFWYTISPPLTAVPKPGDPPSARNASREMLAKTCFADERLTEGPCKGDVLPRAPASTTVEVSRVVGRIGELAGGGYGVHVAVLVTAGEDAPQEIIVGADARCHLGDAVHDVSLPLLMVVHDLRPGESSWQENATTSGKGLPTAPESCTIELRAAENGTKRRLAEWCIRGEEATEGACA